MNNKYIILNKQLNISKDREKYNEVRKLYVDYSKYLIEEFEEVYIKENKSLKDVYDNVLKQGNKRIIQISNITSELLREENIIKISGEELFQNYKKTDRYNVWKREVENIRIKYLELEYGKEYVNKLYENKEKNRYLNKDEQLPKINILNKGIAYFEKNNIYKDKKTVNSLKSALYNTCFSMHYDYINIVEKNKGEKIYSNVDIEDEMKSDKLFKNLKNLTKDKDYRLDLFLEIISINPYKEKYYEYIFMEFGDENGELERLALNFGINLNSYKLEKLEEHYARYNLEIKENGEKIKYKAPKKELVELVRLYLIKINLINHVKVIRLDTDNPVINEIDKAIKKSRERFKLVNGIEFQDFKSAVFAKLEREFIENSLEKIDLESIAEIKKITEKINKDIKSDIKYDYLSRLNKKLESLIDDEIGMLVKKSKAETIEELENLIHYILKMYKEEENQKYIKKLNNKIIYLKTKDKVSETYDEVVEKGKELFKKLFD